jgi:positive phototaxis protein PixI
VSDSVSQPNLLFDRERQIGNNSQEEKFLKFYLEPDTHAVLPVEQIAEVLKISLGKIVPIPQMPSWVMGAYNWRGNILWTIDLGLLIGLNSWYRQGINTANYTAIVLSCDNATNSSGQGSQLLHLGLVVTGVEDIEWCNTDLIQSPPNSAVTSALAPLLRGYWLDRHNEMILVLDGKAIMAAMPSS